MAINTSDKALLAAMRAMAGQLQDEKTRCTIEGALRGEQPKPVAVADTIRQQIVSGNEAARILNCTRRTVVTLANSGAIRRASFPGRTKAFGYDRDSVEALVAGAGQ